MDKNLDYWIDQAIGFATTYGLKIIGAIVIWIVGSWIIKKLLKAVRKILDKGHYEESLKKFLLNLMSALLKVLLVITLLGTLGVPTTSFAAVIAAAGLAIGLALQGSLGNFAGGVLLMIFKPIKIGDFIEAQGESGTVKEIEIFTTKLNTTDNKEIIIPNGALSNGNIVNYSTEDTRRVDFTFGVGYDSDIKKTKDVLLGVVNSHPLVLKEPATAVNVSELADSSINFFTRVWVKKEDYWTVKFDIIEQTKEALDAAGIDIPYPHQVEIQKQG
ncbi:small conductance mechanosensitive channel [Bizionia echini]|uniref:Small conductance mechanosensitive channel n=1 Tax=Bizionia echini TaxID=649333 RepID=A0A1I4ZTQ8_9FLAO|nr:mechanosensitive ion channel domain-containing protein [Bizionia echini]SFN53568.1 small conductance mechanosensitive channel [Bizionia echini]